tara:strand:- start:365 stop:511 length:147 start_codon:yes stop_codon:yes gene_type:complete
LITIGRLLTLALAVLVGHFWGAEIINFAIDVWQDAAETARPKLEEVMK